MDMNEVDVLMVEDSPNDAELIGRALRKINIANKIHWVKEAKKRLNLSFAPGDMRVGMRAPLSR